MRKLKRDLASVIVRGTLNIAISCNCNIIGHSDCTGGASISRDHVADVGVVYLP